MMRVATRVARIGSACGLVVMIGACDGPQQFVHPPDAPLLDMGDGCWQLMGSGGWDDWECTELFHIWADLQEHENEVCQQAGMEMEALAMEGALIKWDDIESGHAAFTDYDPIEGEHDRMVWVTPHFFEKQDGFESVTHRQHEIMAHEIIGHIVRNYTTEIDFEGADWACWCNPEPADECQEWHPDNEIEH